MATETERTPDLFGGYVPVLHQGYLDAISQYPGIPVKVFDKSITSLLPYLRKDIRALSPDTAASALEGLGIQAHVMGRTALHTALSTGQRILMPDDDLTRVLQKQYPSNPIPTTPVFLRWDRDNSQENATVVADRVVKVDSDEPLIQALHEERMKSSNWWRRIAAAITDSDKEVLLIAHNSPLPTEHTSLLYGDPRITARKGDSIERSIDIHAEAQLIAHAAKRGISLEGKDLLVTTFPCANCAKIIAESGVRSCYFIDGYATVDGLDVLRAYNIEVVQVDTNLTEEPKKSLRPYPSS